MENAASPPLSRAIVPAFMRVECVGPWLTHHCAVFHGLNDLRCYFVGVPPPHEVIDYVLRECLEWAANRDDSGDIAVFVYLLSDAGTDLRKRKALRPYGRDHILCFDAHLRQIGVRRMGSRRFVASDAVITLA